MRYPSRNCGRTGDKGRWLRKMQSELSNEVKRDEIDWDIVRGLMFREQGLDPNWTDTCTLMTTLHQSAFKGAVDIMTWCLKKGADVNGCTTLGRTPLHYACAGNSPTCVRQLLNFGADINHRTLSGLTALHLCASYSSFEAAVELLSWRGGFIDVDAEDSRQQKADDIARENRIANAIRSYRETPHTHARTDLVEQVPHEIASPSVPVMVSQGQEKCIATICRTRGASQDVLVPTPRVSTKKGRDLKRCLSSATLNQQILATGTDCKPVDSDAWTMRAHKRGSLRMSASQMLLGNSPAAMKRGGA